MERAAFLDNVRSKLAAPAHSTRPIAPLAEIPSIRYPATAADLTDRFVRAAEAHGAIVRRVGSLRQLEGWIREFCSEHSMRRIALSDDPEVEALRGSLGDFELIDGGSRQALARADLGITGCSAAIAFTGSIVVDAARSLSRSTSLVPPFHLALVPRGHILPSASEFVRSLAERYPGGPPSQFVFITGPSRSADIEFTLTVGVHGPSAVYIVVLEDGFE